MTAARTFLVALFVFLATPFAGAAPGAPMTPFPTPPSGPPLLHEVFGCDTVYAFCRGRFGAGADFRTCVRRRGCPAPVRRRVSYCQQQVRICSNRWFIGSPPFRRCMAVRGC